MSHSSLHCDVLRRAGVGEAGLDGGGRWQRSSGQSVAHGTPASRQWAPPPSASPSRPLRVWVAPGYDGKYLGSVLHATVRFIRRNVGPIAVAVTRMLQAASDAGKNLKVYAVEKNPNAVVTLHVSQSLAAASCINIAILSYCDAVALGHCCSENDTPRHFARESLAAASYSDTVTLSYCHTVTLPCLCLAVLFFFRT